MTMLMRITTCFNVACCLCAVALWLMLFFPALPALAVDGAGDEFPPVILPPSLSGTCTGRETAIF